MAKLVGYEVIGQRPVCVDFSDGRSVSFTPGMRFEAHPTNSTVRRLLKTRSVRELSGLERVPSLPDKLGAPKKVRQTLETRKKLAQERRKAQLKLSRGSKKTEPKTLDEMKPIDLGSLDKPSKSGDSDSYES